MLTLVQPSSPQKLSHPLGHGGVAVGQSEERLERKACLSKKLCLGSQWCPLRQELET